MGKIFISYSRADSLEFTRELHSRLVRDGVDCFFDEASIEWGDNFVLSLEDALEESDHIIVVLSPGFVNSNWTAIERTSATHDDPANLTQKILPLLYRSCEVPSFLKPIHYLDVTTDELFDQHYLTICQKLGGIFQPRKATGDYRSPPTPGSVDEELSLKSEKDEHDEAQARILQLESHKEITISGLWRRLWNDQEKSLARVGLLISLLAYLPGTIDRMLSILGFGRLIELHSLAGIPTTWLEVVLVVGVIWLIIVFCFEDIMLVGFILSYGFTPSALACFLLLATSDFLPLSNMFDLLVVTILVFFSMYIAVFQIRLMKKPFD